MLNTVFGSLSVGVTPSTSSYESIATVTVGSGGSSTITFSSIPSTYTHLQLRFLGKTGNGSYQDDLMIRFNSDSSTGNYYSHRLFGYGSVVADTLSGYGYATAGFIGGGTAGSSFGSGVTDILDYASTVKNKTIRALTGIDTNSSGAVAFTSGAWFSTSAITRIDLYSFSGTNFAQYSSFALYGIKGA